MKTLLIISVGLFLFNLFGQWYSRVLRKRNYKMVLEILNEMQQIIDEMKFRGVTLPSSQIMEFQTEITSLKEFMRRSKMDKNTEWNNLFKSLGFARDNLRRLVNQASQIQ